MASDYTCDYCRAVIDTASDESLIVTVHRRVDDDEWGDDDFISGGTDVFRFCSQAHLTTYMERTPLPAARSENDSDDDSWIVGCLVILPILVILLALAVGAAYGLYQLVRVVL